MDKSSKLQKQYFLPFLVLFFLSLSSTTSTPTSTLTSSPLNVQLRSADTTSQHFVLVHGACLGGWSWYKVTNLLQSAGHNVTAPDMAASGINPEQPESLSSLTDYFQPLLSFLEALPSEEKIVLVGHSLGGLGISMAMERFPEKISVAIFVTAAMPGPLFGFLPFGQQKGILGMFTHLLEEAEKEIFSSKLFTFSDSDIEENLFPLSPPEDVSLAKALLRPQKMFGIVESMKDLALTREKYGSVKRVFIKSEKDKMTSGLMVALMLVLNTPDQVVEIKGSDHMVMTSKPLDLADQLQAIALNFPSLADI